MQNLSCQSWGFSICLSLLHLTSWGKYKKDKEDLEKVQQRAKDDERPGASLFWGETVGAGPV